MKKKLLLFIICLLFLNTAYSIDFSKLTFNINQVEAEKIGQRIRFNETGGNNEYLITWNDGEEFVSLGIGHFIWYPETKKKKIFQESFIYFLNYLKEIEYNIPDILKNNPAAFWNSKKDFFEAKDSDFKKELKNFILATIPQQTDFLIKRLNNSVESIINSIDEQDLQEKVFNNFYSVAISENGYYALIDYVNFKGEGISKKETYKGVGWGLLQVLKNMQKDDEPLKSFAHSALHVLEERIINSPEERNENRWREGWTRRVLTYYPEINLNPEINWTIPVIFDKKIEQKNISYKFYALHSPKINLAMVELVFINLPDEFEGKDFSLVGGGVNVGFHGKFSTNLKGSGYHFAGGQGNPARDSGYKKDFTRTVKNNQLEFIFYYEPTDIISNWDPEINRYVKDTEITLTLHPKGEWNNVLKSDINPYNWGIAGVGAGNKIRIVIDNVLLK
jgi:hypothetical protein